MKLYLGTDHAGFRLKEALKEHFLNTYDVYDCGAFVEDLNDDYPDFINQVAKKIQEDLSKGEHPLGIILGGSGQAEAIAANRFRNIRAVVYYGPGSKEQIDADGSHLDILKSTKMHNDANVLSLGARFLTTDDAIDAAETWLHADFSGHERHIRRLKKIDSDYQ